MLLQGAGRGLGSQVSWVQGPAEEVPGVGEGEADIISICQVLGRYCLHLYCTVHCSDVQALHWTEPLLLYPRVHSCLKPGGVLAVIGYTFTRYCTIQVQCTVLAVISYTFTRC